MGFRRLAGIGILAAAAAFPAAQGTFSADGSPSCPQIVHAALDATEQYCERTGRNKVCYGNVRVEVEPRPELENFVFDQRGDTVDVADVESIRTTPMNPRTGEWGVALMRLQALRGSEANLTLVLMGDAELGQPQPLAAAQTTPASRRSTAAQGPMYAFAFRSAQGDAQCAEVPESGMLIQTPEGVAEVTLLINEVDVQLGSTVYFQAEPGRALQVYVLEGHAELTAQGASEKVPAGATAAVPLDQSNRPAGPPSAAKPYRPEQVANAPLPLLERPIEIAPPADDAQLAGEPSATPSETPTDAPTDAPTETPTASATPSLTPTEEGATPTFAPTIVASATPTDDPPTVPPTEPAALTPTRTPTQQATPTPTATPPGHGRLKPPGRPDPRLVTDTPGAISTPSAP